jgi:hypothetical protein
MPGSLPEAVLEAVQRIAERPEAPSEAALTTLAEWFDHAIAEDRQTDIEALLERTEPGSLARRHLRYVLDAQAGQQGAGEGVLHLFGIPLFLELRDAPDVEARFGPLPCATEIARTLEYALTLPAQSVRMASFASNADLAYALTPHAWRVLARDVFAQCEHGWQQAARVGLLPRPGALWMGTVWLAPGDAALLATFGQMNAQRPALAAYRHRTAELLERDLSQTGVSATVRPYMPVLLPQLFAAYRALELNLRLADFVRPWRASAHTLAWRGHAGGVTVRALDATGRELGAIRLHTGETAAAELERLVAGSARQLGLASQAD